MTEKSEHTVQWYFNRGAEFHGYLSPGLVVGIFMVDLAKELLGLHNNIDAVVETRACIPDAIQLMTSCTYGNGWMRIKDWGKMALTLYSKEKREGIRVFVDSDKIRKYPLVYQWYSKSGNVDKEEVVKRLMDIKRDILSWQRVRVTQLKKVKGAPIGCTCCGETHPADNGELCKRCSGSDDYYELLGEGIVAHQQV